MLKLLRETRSEEIDLKRDREMLSWLTPDYYSLLSRMEDAGLAHRLQNGKYLLERSGEPHSVPAIRSLAGLASRFLQDVPYYASWHTALYHHGLTEQQSSGITIAVDRKKRDVRALGYQIRFIRVKPERMSSGIAAVTIGEDRVQMATVERALVDSFDRPHFAAPFSLVAHSLLLAWQEGNLDPEQLVQEVLNLGKGATARRIGYFMDRWSIPGSDQLIPFLGRGYAVSLAPGTYKPKPGEKVNSNWGVALDPGILHAAENPK
jgi:predicted transcriptional regulator of viral defense system